MPKINVDDVPWTLFSSPKGRFRGASREISRALGAPDTRSAEAHPFDLVYERLAPGETYCPYHAHAAQWELFYVLEGSATSRVDGREQIVRAGDVLLHPPGEAHQLTNTGERDLLYLIVANNPALDVCTYPDSGKIAIDDARTKLDGRLIETDYFDGEE